MLNQLIVIVGEGALEVEDVEADWEVFGAEERVNRVMEEASGTILDHLKLHAKHVIQHCALSRPRTSNAEHRRH